MKTLLLLILACAPAYAQMTTVTVMSPVYDSLNGTSNLLFPYVVNVAPSSQGNYITFSTSGMNATVSPTSVNPAGATISGTLTTTSGVGGFTGMLSLLDNDLNVTTVGMIKSIGPGTYVATNSSTSADPVSTATGELFLPNIPADFSLGGPLPLGFRRYYGSLISASGIATTIGNNWMHNFDWYLQQAGSFAEVIRPGGKIFLFQQSGPSWQPMTHELVNYQLVNGTSSGSYQFLDPTTNRIYTFSGSSSPYPLTQVQDRNGNTLTLTRTSASTQIADGLGRTLTFTYDTNGHIVKVADQTGRSVALAYTGSDLTKFTDANGNSETYTYSSAGGIGDLMNTYTLPLGNQPVSQTWDSSGRVATQADSSGDTYTFTYNTTAGTASVKDPLGVVTSQANRIFSDFTSYTDPDGNIISVTYDGNQHRTSLTDRLNGKTTRTFQTASGYMASETDTLGNTTSFSYTSQTNGGFTFFDMTNIQYPDGTSWTVTYDKSGNILSIADQSSKVWKYTYNNRGQRLTSVDPAGRLTTYAYNSADATLASVTDDAGNTTTYSYDTQKRVSQIKFATGDTRSYTYDNRDNLVSTTNERGQTSTFAFNSNNRMAGFTDPLGKSFAATYDANERLTKAVDRNGQSYLYAYDPLGRVKTLTTPAGEVTAFTFNTHGRLASIADAAGNTSALAYNKEDVLSSLTDQLSRKTAYTTDAAGRMVQLTTPLGEIYSLTRNKLGRVVSVKDPTGVTTSTLYDPTDRIVGYSFGASSPLSVSLTRDAGGQPTGFTDPNGSMWTFTYDATGRIASRTDPLARTTSYTYDKRNRLSTVTNALGSQTLTFDPAGNLTRRAYSSGASLAFSFDNRNQVLTGPGIALAYDGNGKIVSSNGLSIARDADDRIAAVTYAPGKTVTYKYNSVGLLASVSDWAGGSVYFTYDAAHEVTSIQRANSRSTKLTYDGDGGLASIVEDAGTSVTLQRDAAGRIVSQTGAQPQTPTLAAGTLPLSYDAAEQVAGFTYDAAGQLKTDALRTYTWDLSSCLLSYNGADGAATSTYDGFGMRVSRTSQGATENYVWNYATKRPALATVQNASGDERYYVYSPSGNLLYAIDAPTAAHHYYHFDASGSTLFLTGDSGTITDSYGIAPYGETVTATGSTANPFTWMGAFGVMQEGNTSLYYIRSRYYDSATARFLSPDPLNIINPLKINPYQYAIADPINHVDATGYVTSDDLSSYSDGAGTIGDALDAASGLAANAAQANLQSAANLLPSTSSVLTGEESVGQLVQNYESLDSLAGNLSTASEIAGGVSAGLSLASGAVQLNTDINNAQQEQNTLSSATDAGEAAQLKALYKLKVQGKITAKQYYDQVKTAMAGASDQQKAALAGMVIDEVTSSLTFVQNQLEGVAGPVAEAAGWVSSAVGSFLFGTAPPK